MFVRGDLQDGRPIDVHVYGMCGKRLQTTQKLERNKNASYKLSNRTIEKQVESKVSIS